MLKYAVKIHQALHQMQAEAWHMWEPSFLFEGTDDELLPRKSYWAVAHYSRYLRPGIRRIEAVDTTGSKIWVWEDGSLTPAGPTKQASSRTTRYPGSRMASSTPSAIAGTA